MRLTLPSRESGTANILLFCFELIGPPRDLEDCWDNVREIENTDQLVEDLKDYLVCETLPSLLLLFTKLLNLMHLFLLL